MRPIFAVASAVALAASAPATEKLNVLLIVSDDLRDTLGCYGNATVKTPNIDALAARGVRFDRAYAQYPVCNPSRTSFLTGLRVEQTGVVGNTTLFRTLLPDIVTLPQHLRGNGWHTASFGKIYHAAAGGERERWMDLGKSWDVAQMFAATPAGRIIDGRNLTGGTLRWCEWGMTAGTDDDQPDGQTALHAIQTIEARTASGQPWMVGAGFHRPHDPFVSPKKYFELYPPGSLKIYHDPADATPLRPLSLPNGMRDAFAAFTEKEREEFQRAYYAGVSFMDAQIGRLTATLDRLKLWDRTLVILIGDHGYHHNERGWWNKNTLFERSCRVPCIIAAPGAKPGTTARGLVELVDLYPTIADYLGLPPPSHVLAGRSLRPQLENPAAPGRDAACTLVTRGATHGQAIRTERWRFIQWSDGTAELYDHDRDPEETHDVSADPANAKLILDLKAKLAQKVGPYRPREIASDDSASAAKKKKKKS